MKSEGNFVAVTYKACPICGTKDEEQSELLLHQCMRDISELHNQVTGFGKPCDKCQEGIDQGAIMIIVVDQSKSGDLSNPAEWFRTGNIIGLKQEAIERMIQPGDFLDSILKRRALVMDYKDAIEIGLPVDYTP